MKKAKTLALGLAALASFVSFGTLARAQQQPQPLKVTKVKDNVYWIQGGVGSNDGGRRASGKPAKKKRR